MGYGSLFLYHGNKPIGDLFGGHRPVGGRYPIGGHHSTGGGHHHLIGGGHHLNPFVGDIRGDKFYNSYDGFQQISSSKPVSLFRGVNYFPPDGHSAFKESVDRDKKEI